MGAGTAPAAGSEDEAARTALAQGVGAAVDQLERSPREANRRDNLLYWHELYLGRKLGDLYSLDSQSRERVFDDSELVFNLCYSIVCTIRNRVCSFRPRAQFLPNGGDYKDRRIAREQTDMSDAWAHKVKYQDEASFMFRDLTIGDGGVLKLGIDGTGDRRFVDLGRYPAWEFLFDEVESIYRRPECAYHVTYLPIEKAAAKYSIEVDKLHSSIVSAPMGIRYGGSDRNMVRLAECWRSDLDKGRHVAVVGNVVTVDEDWKYDGPPLIVRSFDEGIIGRWGTGAIEMIADLQLELNECHQRFREGHAMSAIQRIAIQESDTTPTKISNESIAVDKYKNTPPVYQAVIPMAKEWFEYAEFLKKEGYETLGISPFIAAGVKQPGTTSALAIQESTELQQDRLALLSQLWEGMVVESAEWWDRLSARLVAAGVPQSFRSVQRGAYRELKFPEGDPLTRREVRVYPSSIFGSTLAGRLERANYLIDKGWLSREDAMKVADVPDLSPVIDLELAPSYAMEKVVDDILEAGAYQQPPPYLDAGALFGYARKRYLLAFSTGEWPAAHMSQLSKLIDAVEPKPPAPPALGMAPPPMPGPTAVPMPPGLGGPPPGGPAGPQIPIPPPAGAPAPSPTGSLPI